MNRRHLLGNFVDNPEALFKKTRAKLKKARSFIQSRRSLELVFRVRSYGEQIDP